MTMNTRLCGRTTAHKPARQRLTYKLAHPHSIPFLSGLPRSSPCRSRLAGSGAPAPLRWGRRRRTCPPSPREAAARLRLRSRGGRHSAARHRRRSARKARPAATPLQALAYSAGSAPHTTTSLTARLSVRLRPLSAGEGPRTPSAAPPRTAARPSASPAAASSRTIVRRSRPNPLSVRAVPAASVDTSCPACSRLASRSHKPVAGHQPIRRREQQRPRLWRQERQRLGDQELREGRQEAGMGHEGGRRRARARVAACGRRRPRQQRAPAEPRPADAPGTR